MKVKFLKWYNVVLTTLLGLLGFASCSKEENMDAYGPPVMYGPGPQYNYEVKGVVTDEDGNPIEGIKAVIQKELGTMHIPYSLDSTQTDAQGEYDILMYPNYRPANSLKLVLEDTDGEENGGDFQSDTIKLDDMQQKKTMIKVNPSVSVGGYELTDTIKLKKKES